MNRHSFLIFFKIKFLYIYDSVICSVVYVYLNSYFFYDFCPFDPLFIFNLSFLVVNACIFFSSNSVFFFRFVPSFHLFLLSQFLRNLSYFDSYFISHILFLIFCVAIRSLVVIIFDLASIIFPYFLQQHFYLLSVKVFSPRKLAKSRNFYSQKSK